MVPNNPHEKLIARYRSYIFGLPDSEWLMPLMTLRYTVDEAEFLSRMPFMPHTMEQLVEKLRMPSDELLARMAPLVAQGMIYQYQGRSGTRYAMADQVFANYRMPGLLGRVDDWNRKLAPLLNRYYTHHLGADIIGHPTKGLRTIPIAGTIEDRRAILPYEDILGFVDRETHFAVGHCQCRHRRNLDPDHETCRHETETCLQFGRMAQYTAKYEIGRKITREETLEILKSCADAGLVHGISNFKTGMDTICNCCSCCCLFLENIRLNPPAKRGHQPSNYQVHHNPKTCQSCGQCAQGCPMGAIEVRGLDETGLVGELERMPSESTPVFSYNPELCIGCGVCSHKCPTQSIKLVRRDGPEQDIPDDPKSAAMRLLTERSRDLSKIF